MHMVGAVIIEGGRVSTNRAGLAGQLALENDFRQVYTLTKVKSQCKRFLSRKGLLRFPYRNK